MPIEVTSLTTLTDMIRVLPSSLICIDGYHGAGKSRLARTLAYQLGIKCTHLDDFLEPDMGSFVEAIRPPRLAMTLEERPLIVEGVCLLAVLERFGVKPDALIYVKDDEPDPESPRGRGPLSDEVRAYHTKYRPIDAADFIYVAPHRRFGPQMNPTRADIDIAFIQAKTKISIALATGGILTLGVGLAVLLYGVTGNDNTLVRIAGFEASASGIGGVIMATSVVWAFLSYRSRPGYAQIRQSSESYGEDGNIIERHSYESSTQIIVGRGPERKRARK